MARRSISETVLSAYDLSGGDTNSTAIAADGVTDLMVSVSQSSVTGTTKTVACKLQASADGVTGWFDTDATNDAVTTADAADSSVGFKVNDTVYPFLRVNVDAHADVTGGALTIKLWGRVLED